MEIIGGSGCVGHILPKAGVPGTLVSPPGAKRRGRGFVTAGGGGLPLDGQVALMMGKVGGELSAKSAFQAAGVSRPLVSIAGICGNGNAAALGKEKAVQ